MVSNVAGYSGLRVRDASPGHTSGDSRTFARTAAIAYGFGGIVVPVVGWLIGVLMLVRSPQWTRRQKTMAIAVPTALSGIVALVTMAASAVSAGAEGVSALPSGYDVAWSGLAIVMIVTATLALWLMHSMRE
ncbi:hypothetical protein [Paramicrobacterium fandaimingii]|uniref:hypothetical protein n=1 Tax=Paramicrobacterium fandaimingii TaxID=2708079 RepID=UPI00141EFC1F|nr:hypothetical protein [Microbacterium fandaimingii]